MNSIFYILYFFFIQKFNSFECFEEKENEECPPEFPFIDDNCCVNECESSKFLIKDQNKCESECPPEYYIYNKTCYLNETFPSDFEYCDEYYINSSNFIDCITDDNKTEYPLLLNGTRRRLKNCSEYSLEFKEYKGKCYYSCPNKIGNDNCTCDQVRSNISSDECVQNCDDENPLIIGNLYCGEMCGGNSIYFNLSCQIGCPNLTKPIYSNIQKRNICECINYYYFKDNYMICNDIPDKCDENTEYKYLKDGTKECVDFCGGKYNKLFNNICYRFCPKNTEEIEEEGNLTCKCKYLWYMNEENKTICLEDRMINSEYPYQIGSTKQLVNNCSDYNYSTFNKECVSKCPNYSSLNDQNFCECLYLYSVYDDNKICHPKSQKECGLEYPFMIQVENSQKYCMKFCPQEYKYMFGRQCYKKCPYNLKENEEKKTCECPNYYYYDINQGGNVCKDNYFECFQDGYNYVDSTLKECMKQCKPNKYIFEKFCVNICPNNAYILSENSIECNCIDKFSINNDYEKECYEMIDNYNKNSMIISIINYNVLLMLSKNSIIKMNNLKIEVVNINKQEAHQKSEKVNLTKIDFLECENIIRKIYSIDDDEELILAKIDIKPLNEISITNPVKYQLYDPQGNLLNLSFCEKTNIKIIYPITNLTLANFDYAKELLKNNVDIYDFNSFFYNDYCNFYQINGRNIPIYERRKEVLVKVNLCQKNCELEKIDVENEKIICNCKIDINAEINNDEVYYDIPKVKFDKPLLFNYKIIHCHQYFSNFSKNNLKNLGFWIGVLLNMGNIILIFIFFINEYKILRAKLFKLFAGNPPIKEAKSSNEIIHLKNNNSINDNFSSKTSYQNIFIKKEKSNSLFNYELYNNEIEKEDNYQPIKYENYSGITFEKAKIYQSSNFFLIGTFTIFSTKIEIVSLIFFREKYHCLTLFLSLFTLRVYLNLTLNCFLFTDGVTEEIYMNGGKCSLKTSILLSFISNCICCVIYRTLKKLISYSNYISVLEKITVHEKKFDEYSIHIFRLISLRILICFIIEIIIYFCCFYYMCIFCYIYKSIQMIVLKNFFIGILVNLIIQFIFAFMINLLRFLAFRFDIKGLYYSANFLYSI